MFDIKEMDTPITISSGSTEPSKSEFLQMNYTPNKHKRSVISIESSSFDRVPVSWDMKNRGSRRTDSNTTLTNIQKVSNWIKSIEGDDKSEVTVDLNKNSSTDSKMESTIEPLQEDGTDAKSVILFRCDFNKSVTAKTYYPPLNPFNRATSLIDYFKTDNRNNVTKTNRTSCSEARGSAIPRVTPNNLKSRDKKNTKKHLLLKRSNSAHLIDYPSQINKLVSIENRNETYSKASDEKSEGSSDVYEVPLSPESRKKELCSYLQLMNPADKKEILILQNRRSTRVKNLAALQEKRELERKIKQTEVIDANQLERYKEPERCAMLKSFKELNIKVEKFKPSKEYLEDEPKDVEKDSFYFPFPLKSLIEEADDFDKIMSKLIPRYKRICKLKNLKLNSKFRLKKLVPKNKDSLLTIPKVKRLEISAKTNSKLKKINKIKNLTPKGRKIKALLKNRYKKNTEHQIFLRSGAKKFRNILKNYKKKNIQKREDKTLNKKPLERQVLKKPEPEPETSRKNSIRSTSVPKSVNSYCEIVTVADRSDDRIDLENFMDDMIDFNNLSEEHKKCLIESRILSTKPLPQMSAISNKPDVNPKMSSKPTCNFNEISPLYGFNKPNMNEVKKICEAYKNSMLLKNCEEIMQDCFLDSSEIKEEKDKEDIDLQNEKESNSSPIEKLATTVIDNVIDQDFIPNFDDEIQYDTVQENIEDKPDLIKETTASSLVNGVPLQEHNYAGILTDDEDQEKDIDVVTVPSKNLPVGSCIQVNLRQIETPSKYELLPYNKTVEMKSLHRSLQYTKRKRLNGLTDPTFSREWDTDSLPKQRTNKQSHYISINNDNGAILKAFYIDYNLIVCQECTISLWMQTPLGNVLGSQNMWVPRGETQRLVLNNKCVQKESMEMVVAMETHVAYIELWTKEHKSDIREGPVADVFAAVYFWKQRQNSLERKALQLENIKGFADGVQYSVMRCCAKIIVSWHSANEDSSTRRTFIHSYQLAPDYQTVANIYDIEPVDHYVSSLHNIEDCDNLIMGCGENKITLWNVEYGYIVATIELTEIKSPLCTLWVKCDRGFLFALQQCVDRELRLIAINGINHSWKKLASYIPPDGFDRLRGVCIENGLLLSFYDQGILCWKAETGEPIEETNIETEMIPSGKYVILLEGNRIIVKHALTHLMSLSLDE